MMEDATEFSQSSDLTLGMLGCGNLGSAILANLLDLSRQNASNKTPIRNYHISVRTEVTRKKLADTYGSRGDHVAIGVAENVSVIKASDVIILAVDPADVDAVLQEKGVAEALSSPASSKTNGNNKLLISVAAGWSRDDLEKTLLQNVTDRGESSRPWILRVLPNVAAAVGQSLTAIEITRPGFVPRWSIELTDAIFSQVGQTVHIPPSLMDAVTAVGGSTPAFWATLCDALIDAAVAVGVPRSMAQVIIFQSMLGTATMMQNGLHPALLKDQGTSPEGCTIGGLMVLEETAVRGNLGRALREAVTIARQMGTNPHPNDTRATLDR